MTMINRTHLTTTTDLSAEHITEAQENTNEFIDELMHDASIIEHTDITDRNIDVINNKSIDLTPDEFIAKLNSGTLPNITIVVTGNVILENSNIYNLPGKLTITGDLIINYCNNITNMPANLNVVNLYIEKCQSLTALASDITIQNHLSITECPIQELPDNLELQSLEITDSNIVLKDNITIHKNLTLFGCPNVSQLPKFSDTTKNITLMYCGNISLPSLTIKNNLTLEHCDIRTIPEQMAIGENFFITSCPYITSLPSKILISGDLKIVRCGALISLPECWFANIPQSLPFIDKKKHSITLINSSIPEIAIKKYYFQCLPKNIHVIQEQDFSMPILTTNKKLENLIAFWLQIIAKKNNINITNITVAEIKDLILFLQKLIHTRDFLNKLTRKQLATEVVNILQIINRNDEIKEDILAVINAAVTSCEDRVLLSLADIIFLPLLKQAENQSIVDATGTALKKLAKQKLYADEITQYAVAYAKEEIHRRNRARGRIEPIEEIEFILDFKIKLGNKFDLHFTNRSMNYAGVSHLQTSDADTAYEIINAKVTEDYFNNYLQNWEPWKKHQRRWLLQEYSNLKIKPDHEVNIDEDSRCIITSASKNEITDPIIYNNTIYSYAAFCEWYINKGTNPLNPNELIDINNIFALK
jgi:hypothetical protein